MATARSDERVFLLYLKRSMLEPTTYSQESIVIKDRVELPQGTAFRNDFPSLQAGHISLVCFLLYTSDDNSLCL